MPAAQMGAAALVPPPPFDHCPPFRKARLKAVAATSGSWRWPLEYWFLTPVPCCQEGWEKMTLTPPPPPQLFRHLLLSGLALNQTGSELRLPWASTCRNVPPTASV